MYIPYILLTDLSNVAKQARRRREVLSARFLVVVQIAISHGAI
jgi:hypothetical protein